jgi:outer membrane usher protein
MPATSSHASRSPSRERLRRLLTIVALVTVARAAAGVSAEAQLLADAVRASTAAQQLADAAGDLASGPPGSRARRPADAGTLPSGELVVGVKVNNEPQGEAIVVQDPERGLLVERADLVAWRVATPADVLLRNDVEYIALGLVPGLRAQLDRRSGVLAITVEVSQFLREDRVIYDLAVPVVADAPLGAFVNYDAEVRQSFGVETARGYAQLGLFGGPGVLTSDWALTEGEATRLNTTFVHDSLARIATLRVGDFTGANSTLGPGVSIGGLSWGTNFATRPGLVPIPLQRLQGQVSVPSTVEVFVNGVPAYRAVVQPGPFTITDIPVVTGGGTVEMVITDPLGRKQTVSNPFYATPTVLRAGLTEYAYEVGWTRVPSTSSATLVYDQPVARLVHRAGLTDRFTAEVQLEGAEGQGLLGAAGAWLLPGGGVMRFGLASSSAPSGDTGALGLLGYERLFDRWSVSGEIVHESAGFAQLGGQPLDPLHSRQHANLALSYHTPALGSLSFSALKQRDPGGTDAETGTVTWSRSLFTSLSVQLSVSYDDVSGDSSAFASFSLPFWGEANASLIQSRASPASGADTTDTQFNLQRNVGTGPSWGYRLGGAQGGDALAELDLQGEVGSWRAGGQRVAGVDSSFVSANGSLVFVDGSLHASRRLNDGFALVRVPGAVEVGVYADNNFIGRTDADGERLVPFMTPYRPTNISLDATELPLELQLATDHLSVTVPYRTAAVVAFPAELTHAYAVTLKQRNGKPIPAGARVRFDDDPTEHPVGSDGFVYLTVEPGPHRVEALWPDHRCSATLTIQATDDPAPDLGVIVCSEE